MAESKRSSSSNSSTTSKGRKSRNDIVRSVLGMHLKQKNYSANEKFRKSDLALTQSMDQYDISMMLENDLAKQNIISYSNVLCLSNNQTTVELQFSKFIRFVQSQVSPTIKSELQSLLWPLICHIYIEMLKGRDSKPALDFLRKYAHLVGPVENLQHQIVSKQNGNDLKSAQENSSSRSASPATPSANTQILFSSSDIQDDSDPVKVVNSFFKEMIQILSTCARIDEIESIEMIQRFRHAKYEIVLSLQALYAIKTFLAKNGHVIILHILQTWFSFEICDALLDSDVDEMDADDDDIEEPSTPNDVLDNGIIQNHVNGQVENDPFDSDARPNDSNVEIQALLAKIMSEVKIINGLKIERPQNVDEGVSVESNPKETESKSLVYPVPLATMVDTEAPSPNASQINFNVVQNKYLQNVRAAVLRSRKMEPPMRVLNIMNTDSRLCAGDIDIDECHLACAFNDSTIKLWQLNQSRIRGKKPYSSIASRQCEWSLEICESSSDESDDNVDDYDDKSFPQNYRFSLNKNLQKRKEIQRQKKLFMEQRCDENIFSETEGLTLRGHNSGVTDLLFSKYNPVMFSVSKDNTMRAWKACNYQCAAIYRGHNYPIWCVAENSTGSYLATGSRDLTARLWSTEREHPVQTYIGHTQDVETIAFHPNGNYLATGSTDLTVRLWDVTSGKLLRVFIDCHLPISCVSFSPDGKYLAAAGEETKIRVFDLAAGSQFTELKDHSAAVTSIVWNSSGNKVASCCTDGSLRVFALNRNSQNAGSSTNNQSTTNSSGSNSSSSSTSIKSLISNETGCKRAVRIVFNSNDTVTCIGNT